MHTATHWTIPTDILNVPSIDMDELEAMIAEQTIAPPQKRGARLGAEKSERHDRRNRR